MPNPVDLNVTSPQDLDPDRALAGEYGPEAQEAFEFAATLMEEDTSGNDALSGEEFDAAAENAGGEWEPAEGMDGATVTETYGGEDGELSVQELAQAYLHGVIVTPGGTSLLSVDGGTFKPTIRLAAVASDSQPIKGLNERETRILAAAYGTKGELSDEQMEQIVEDGVLARDGDGYKSLNLGKMSSERTAKAFLVTDSNHDGVVNADEFDSATDLIFDDKKAVSGGDAETLVSEYGKDGLLDAKQIKQMMDDRVLLVEPGRKKNPGNAKGPMPADGSRLIGRLDFDNLPSKQTAYMSKDANGNGKLDAEELKAFFDEDKARILVAAYGEKGEVNEDQIKKMISDDVIRRDGDKLTNFNFANLSDDRVDNAFFAFDDNHDGVINAEEFDKASDIIFKDDKLVDRQEAKTLVSAYGKDGLLNGEQVKAILDDGVLKHEPAKKKLRVGTTPDGSHLAGTLNLGNIPTAKLPGAFLAFDENGDGLDAKELDKATDVISHGDKKLVTRDEAEKIVKAMAGDAKTLKAEDINKLIENKVFFNENGKLVYNDRGVSSALLEGATTPTPWAEDYFDYIDKTKLPGTEGTVNDLAFQRLLEDYKDEPEGSDKRKFYDYVLAKYFTENGYSNPDEFHGEITGEEFSSNILDSGKVDTELEELMQDEKFSKTLSDDLTKYTNDVISENFVLVDGKITLKTDSNKDALPVDGTAWARAGLAYTRSEEGREEYRLGTPEEQQEFIKKYFGALGHLLPADEVSAALGELGVMTAVDAIAEMDLDKITDDDLASALQIAGQYVMQARGPTNLIGNLSNMTKADWLSLARALKLTSAEGKLDFQTALKSITNSSATQSTKELVRALGASGMWGTFAGAAGVIGAVLTYSADGPARDRLLAGDPREILGLSQTLSLVLSYSTSIVKGTSAGLGKLLSQIGFSGVEDFYNDFKALPGFSGLVQHSSAFQPTFSGVADALQGVDLSDRAAIKAALAGVKEETRRLWADIGYDFNKLADRIYDHAREFNVGVYGPDVTSSSLFTGEERLGFLYDMTGVDKNYKYLVRANEIIDGLDTDARGKIKDEATLREALKAGGMKSEEALNGVVGSLDVLSRDGAPKATGNRKALLDLFPDSKLPVTNALPDGTSVARPLIEDGIEKFLNIGTADTKLTPIKLERATAGLLVKGLGAAMDVIGGALGVATGIYDIVKGADSGDKAKIATGALGLASGVLGALGGLAGFGMLGSVASGPLFIVAGVIGVVALIVSLFSGKHPADEFVDGVIGRFKNYDFLKSGAEEYLRDYFRDNWKQYDPPASEYVPGGGKP